MLLITALFASILVTTIAQEVSLVETHERPTKLFPIGLLKGLGILEDEIEENMIHNNREISPSLVKRANDYLDWLNMDLKGFVNATGFDFLKFNQKMEMHRRDLADIEFFIESRLSHEQEVENHRRNVRKLFQLMVDSTEKLCRYTESEILGSNVISEIIQLKVRVAVMMNGGSTFSLQTNGYIGKISKFVCEFDSLKVEHKKYTGMPYGMNHLFEALATEVRETLEPLREQAGFRPGSVIDCSN